jgi:DNA-directed RNA polymerase specialized sigma24 family protein
VIDWPLFMREEYPAACRAIARVMPRRRCTIHDADDWVMDAIAELVADDRASLALVVWVARRRMIDYLRSPRSRPQAMPDDDPPSRNPSVDLQYDAAELRSNLLDPRCHWEERMMVEWRLDGYSSPEIARMSGIRLRTVERFFRWYSRGGRHGSYDFRRRSVAPVP